LKKAAVLEATAPIPKLQEDVTELKEAVHGMQPRLEVVEETVCDMKTTLDATFEEVGSLRRCRNNQRSYEVTGSS